MTASRLSCIFLPLNGAFIRINRIARLETPSEKLCGPRRRNAVPTVKRFKFLYAHRRSDTAGTAYFHANACYARMGLRATKPVVRTGPWSLIVSSNHERSRQSFAAGKRLASSILVSIFSSARYAVCQRCHLLKITSLDYFHHARVALKRRDGWAARKVPPS